MLQLIFEFVLFTVVDNLVKEQLKKAQTVSEKRMIWLKEVCILSTMAIVLRLLVGTPYVLLTLTVLTLGYALIQGRAAAVRGYFTASYETLRLKWEEFQHLQESNSPQGQMAPPHREPTMPVYYNPMMAGRPMPLHPQTGYPPPPPGGLYHPYPPPHSQPYMPNMRPRQPSPLAELRQRTADPHKAAASNLARRPLRTYEAYLRHEETTGPRENLNTPMSFRSRLLSAVGIDPYTRLPPGLANQGQNICFLNSVMQALSNTPQLLESLQEQKVPQEKRLSPEMQALISAFREIVQHLNMKPGSSEYSTYDAANLRMAASALQRTLVAHPTLGKQSQQDAAEFLMWLLEKIHSALNTAGPGNPDAHKGALGMLKFIYGDFEKNRVNGLKDACRKEIEQADALDDKSYAEAIQRLSDLEWLSHKEQNSSIIDETFTGQLVETHRCQNCNRLSSVSIQTFSVLPVPILGAVYGRTRLEDCLERFGDVQNLSKTREHKCHNPAPSSVTHINQSQHKDGMVNGEELHGFLPQSPISPMMSNDSGFTSLSSFDSQNRTSTPKGTGNAQMRTNSTSSQDQGRSLLRHLPRCIIFQLNRFTYSQGYTAKHRQPVGIPLTGLDLTSLIFDKVTQREDLTAMDTTYKYELYALCMHIGGESTTYGHYVAYCKAADKKWYRYDDEHVKEVNMDHELQTAEVQENAYLLFYSRTANQ